MEQTLRQQLAEYGVKLVESGLVQGTWGNISVRLDDRYMLTTPSGLDYTRLTAEDMVKVDIQSLRHEGKNKPTSEKELHAEIYKAREDVGCVIHTHSKYACAFAAAQKPMPIVKEFRELLGEELSVTKYARCGTKELAQNTSAALGENVGAIMANHGIVAVGKDLADALKICEKIEENGRIYLLTK